MRYTSDTVAPVSRGSRIDGTATVCAFGGLGRGLGLGAMPAGTAPVPDPWIRVEAITEEIKFALIKTTLMVWICNSQRFFFHSYSMRKTIRPERKKREKSGTILTNNAPKKYGKMM